MSRIYALDQGIFDIVEPRAWAYEYRRGKNHFYLAKWANALAWTFWVAGMLFEFMESAIVPASLMAVFFGSMHHSMITTSERLRSFFDSMGCANPSRHSQKAAYHRVLLFLIAAPAIALFMCAAPPMSPPLTWALWMLFVGFNALSIYLGDCDTMPPKWQPARKEALDALPQAQTG